MNNFYSQILSDLSDSQKSLTDILLKLKIMGYKINNKHLLDFVNNELNGYPQNSELPKYRKLENTLMGTVSNGYQQIRNMKIPISHLSSEEGKIITTCEMFESTSELTEYLTNNHDICKLLSPEYFEILSKNFQNGYYVQKAYVPISKAQISGILTTIRSNLLDLILSLESSFNVEELENLFEQPTQSQKDIVNNVVNTYFTNNFNSYGNSQQNTKIELENDK